MATRNDVRRIALSLAGATEDGTHFAFGVLNGPKVKGFVWSWKERIHPKKPRVPSKDVIAVRVANLADKDFILQSNTTKFFTEPHYNGYPAVMVRLKEVSSAELRPLLEEAWRCVAPKALLKPAKEPAAKTPKPQSSRKPPSPSRASRPRRSP